MDTPRGDDPKDLAGLREWLAQLDRRLAELEQAERVAERRRRRGMWTMLIVGGLYLVLFSYYLSQSNSG